MYMRERRDENLKIIQKLLEEDKTKKTVTVEDFQAKTVEEEKGMNEEEGIRMKLKDKNKEGEEVLRKITNSGLEIENGIMEWRRRMGINVKNWKSGAQLRN